MKGFGLVAVNREGGSGRFNGFFKVLEKGVRPWHYKIIIMPASKMIGRLNRYSRQGMRLIAVTEGGLRALDYIFFFQMMVTPPPPSLRQQSRVRK